MRLLFCSVISLLVLTGCGGGGSGSSPITEGSISIIGDFAPATRTVPGYATELRVVITPPLGVVLPPNIVNPIVLTRSSPQRSLSNLSVSSSPYQLTMTAYTGTSNVGAAVRSIVVQGARISEVDVSANLQSGVDSITVEGNSSVLQQGSTQLTAYARNAQSATLFSGDGFSWSSSNSSILSVDADGTLTGEGGGDAEITATLSGTSQSGSKSVTVIPTGQGAPLISNGDMEIAFRTISTETSPYPFSYPAAPVHWVMNTGAPNRTATSEIMISQAPTGSGSMVRFYNNQGQDGTYNGSALAQYFPATSNVRFECDIKVLQGTVMLGPVGTSGPFYSQTTYTPNGSWRHILIDCPVSTETVAFQNVGPLDSVLEIYLDNVKVYHP